MESGTRQQHTHGSQGPTQQGPGTPGSQGPQGPGTQGTKLARNFTEDLKAGRLLRYGNRTASLLEVYEIRDTLLEVPLELDIILMGFERGAIRYIDYDIESLATWLRFFFSKTEDMMVDDVE
ncbi:hypothetical protein HK102_012328 [Quaeritorhiza haematococci]|nr:hypothetical protein HK102_012328 [Quaeritorhiza haematococci]